MGDPMCDVCGPNPKEVPITFCVPCALAPRVARFSGWSLKRLAWAFGCAKANSDEEIDLFRELKARMRG